MSTLQNHTSYDLSAALTISLSENRQYDRPWRKWPTPTSTKTPQDPTLVARPVPHKRAFPIQSFGPGVAIDASNDDPSRWLAHAHEGWWKEFERVAGTCDYDERENYLILNAIRGSEAVVWREDDVLVPQPTWGFYVFLTDYDQATRDSIPRTIDN